VKEHLKEMLSYLISLTRRRRGEGREGRRADAAKSEIAWFQ